MKLTRSSSTYLPLALALFFVLLTWPVWRWMWGEWLQNLYYSHGFIVVPLAGYLAWRRARNSGNAGGVEPNLLGSGGLALLVVSLLAYLWFLTRGTYYLAALAMIGLIGGLVWTFGGARLARQLAFPIAFLLLMVPLPFVEKATLPLARLTGASSGAIAQALGLDVIIAGSELTLPNANLVIGAQCSGISSIVSLVGMALLLAYALQGPAWARVLLVLLAIPLAMLGNIVRVASLILVAHYSGADAAFNFYHNGSGPVVFAILILLMFPLTRLLGCRTVRSEVL